MHPGNPDRVDLGGVRACVVVYSYYPFDPRVRREVLTLTGRGVDMDVICLQDAGEAPSEVVDGAFVSRLPLAVERGGHLRYLFQYLVFALMSAVRLTAMGLRKRYDIVHVHSLPDFQILFAAPAKLWGARLVLDLHELMPEIYAARFGLRPDSLQVGLAKVAEKVSFFFADRVITTNDTRRGILERRGCPPRKLMVVMNSPYEASYEAGLGLPPAEPGTFRIVYVGGVNPERDLDVLIEAVSKMAQSTKTELHIYGHESKGHFDLLRRIVEESGAADIVFFGTQLPQSEVLRYMRSSDVGVMTYERNPAVEVALPSKAFEFILAEKPLVLPDLHAMRAQFDGAAVFYEPGDSESLAHALERVRRGGEEISHMQRRATEVYQESNWRKMRRRLWSIYADLATRDGRHPNEHPGGSAQVLVPSDD
jgi:glycosyltransferase involved in cell wall biosynthesis